tara:strand:- start:4831 stop:5733 length:903 start_codon:yes stop_codon:yes gene_type:complete
MKLALIISGMLRNFEHTYASTKKFVLEDPFFDAVDIFFAGYSDHLSLNEAKTKFLNLYEPKNFLIEKWSNKIKRSIEIKTGCNKWQRKLEHKGNIINIMSAWRCRYLANQLKIEYEKKNNFRYDFVYHLRSDFFFFDQINHKVAIEGAEEHNSVYVPNHWDFKEFSKIAVGDISAMGSSEAMNKYFSFYLQANTYRLFGIHDHPETILGYHFKFQNIQRKFCERNVAREYPFSYPSANFLWEGKWTIEEVFDEMKIDQKFLYKQIPSKFFIYRLFFKIRYILFNKKFFVFLKNNVKKIFE